MIGNGWESRAAESQPQPERPELAEEGHCRQGQGGRRTDARLHRGQGHAVVPRRLGRRRHRQEPEPGAAAEWTKIFTGTAQQEALLAKGALPNATALLDKAAQVKGNEATAQAPKNSWFTPNAEKWADVEKGNVLQQMLVDIVTGKKSVADATKAADEQITRRSTADRRWVAPPTRRRHPLIRRSGEGQEVRQAVEDQLRRAGPPDPRGRQQPHRGAAKAARADAVPAGPADARHPGGAARLPAGQDDHAVVPEAHPAGAVLRRVAALGRLGQLHRRSPTRSSGRSCCARSWSPRSACVCRSASGCCWRC